MATFQQTPITPKSTPFSLLHRNDAALHRNRTSFDLF